MRYCLLFTNHFLRLRSHTTTAKPPALITNKKITTASGKSSAVREIRAAASAALSAVFSVLWATLLVLDATGASGCGVLLGMSFAPGSEAQFLQRLRTSGRSPFLCQNDHTAKCGTEAQYRQQSTAKSQAFAKGTHIFRHNFPPKMLSENTQKSAHTINHLYYSIRILAKPLHFRPILVVLSRFIKFFRIFSEFASAIHLYPCAAPQILPCVLFNSLLFRFGNTVHECNFVSVSCIPGKTTSTF